MLKWDDGESKGEKETLMATVSDHATINHMGMGQSFINEQSDMAHEIAYPLATRIDSERLRLNSFYAVVTMAVASWLVIGGIGLALYLAM